MHNHKRYWGVKWICWFFMGIILSMSISAMWVSGTWNLNRFFDVGEIYDFVGKEYSSGWIPELEEKDGSLTKILEEDAVKYISFGKTNCQWKYFYIDIKELNQESMIWNFIFYRDSEIVQIETLQLKPGGNIFALSVSDFNRCIMQIPNQQGLSFSISKMQMYEREPEFNGRMLVIRFAAVMICYCIISFLVLQGMKRKKKKRKINLYTPIEVLQKLFLYFSNHLVLPHTENLSLRRRRWIRILLMLVLIVYTNFFDMNGTYASHFHITIVVGSLCILGIGIVSIEKKTRLLNWKNPLIFGWFTLWTVAVISEFVVEHMLSGVGISMIFAFSFLYFVIGNMEYPEYFLQDIAQMIKITFWISTLFCILCRPDIEGLRYKGASYNPAVFGMYEIVAFVTFAGSVEKYIRKKKLNAMRWVDVCGMILSAFFISKTQSVTSMAALGIVIIILAYKMFLIRKSHRNYIIKNVGISILLSIVLCVSMEIALKKIPFLAGTQITFEKDFLVYKENDGVFGNVLMAEASSDNRMIEKIKSIGDLDQFTSGRTFIWKDYIREFNLWGNYGKPIVRSRTENPHNAMIGIGYRYGIFSIIPYGIILLYSLYYIYIGKERNKGNMMEFCYLLTTIVVAMSDNVEQPFMWVSWFILYFMVGYAFYIAEKREQINTLSDGMEIEHEK